MSYLGNEPQFTQYPSKFFNGNGTAQTVALDYAPPNAAAVLVFIDGVRQDTSAYTLAGTNLTFTGSVPSGTNNVQVVHMGLILDVGVPGDGTVTLAKLSTSGSAIAGNYLDGTMTWTAVDSVPDLITEGDVYKNYKTFATNITIPVDADSNQGLIGPIAFTGDVTITGDLTIW